MPYCVAYGCKSKLVKGCGIHFFFKFPKEKPRRKQLIHYCKSADFTQASLASTLCSKHFSSEQYERDPLQLTKFGYENARPRLKPDAVPDIPISVAIPSTSSSLLSTHDKRHIDQPKHGAYEKRSRLIAYSFM